MTDFLREQPQGRELQRLRHEREAEDEVEDVRLREQPRERAPLGRLAAREAAGAVERDVGFGVQRVALEDDEPCVDAAAPERLGRRPRDAGRVDRAEGDPQRAAVAVGAASLRARRRRGARSRPSSALIGGETGSHPARSRH